jgi:hypothetical protein
MNYCKEYKEWTNSNIEYSFSIKEVSHHMRPGDESDVSCDGIGFDGMIKIDNGALFLKMRNEEHEHEYVGFVGVKNKYIPPTK